jgi:hypothetical protein
MLTSGNANLLMAHGTPLQQDGVREERVRRPLLRHDVPLGAAAGSSLSDIVTRATPDGRELRERPARPALSPARQTRCGSRTATTSWPRTSSTWCSPRFPTRRAGSFPGTRGISLFIVPKKLVDEKGELTGERNDVALAGLNHKLGYRGIPNTLLNFGEGKHRVRGGGLDGVGSGAIGYLVGQPGEGLRCMFHMMNEARIRRRARCDHARLRRLRDLARLRQGAAAGPADGRRRQGRVEAAGADHRARRRQAHAAGAKELLRRRAGARALLRPPRRRAAHRRRQPRRRARTCCSRC